MMPKPMRRGASTVRRLPARTLQRLPAAGVVAPVFALTLALAVSLAFPAPAAGEPPLVAAAASLRHVFPALSRAWTDAGGSGPR